MNQDRPNRYRRDFTAEPMRPWPMAGTPVQVPSPAERKPRRQAVARFVKIVRPSAEPKKIVLTSLLVVLILAGAYFWKTASRQTFFNDGVLNTVSFPLYYPSQLPADYQPTPDSMRTTSNLLTFSVALVNGEKLAFSEQPRPQNFNFDNFNTQQVASPSKIDTPIGSGIIGTFSGAKIASIPTGKTWIIITAPYGIADAQLRQIAQGLKLAN